MCVGCPRSHRCVAAGRPRAKSVVGGASASVASAFARLPVQGSFTVHAASARTGSVPHLMGKPATVRSVTLKMTQYSKMSSQKNILPYFKIENLYNSVCKSFS